MTFAMTLKYTYTSELHTRGDVKGGKVVYTEEAPEGWTNKKIQVRVTDFNDEKKKLRFDTVEKNNRIEIEQELPFEASEEYVGIDIHCIDPDRIPYYDETPDVEMEGYCPECGKPVIMDFDGRDNYIDHYRDLYNFYCDNCGKNFQLSASVPESELSQEDIGKLDKWEEV